MRRERPRPEGVRPDELFKGKRDHLYIAVHRVNAKLLKHGREVFGRSLALAEKELVMQVA